MSIRNALGVPCLPVPLVRIRRQRLLPASTLALAAGFLMLLASISTALAQKTIHVPSDQPTIQAGIDAASNGDTVLVAPGTYFENIDFKGKAITVTSSAGPATTTISGPNKTAAASFTHGETRSSVLSNFTITVGGQYYLNKMGGIYINSSSPSILNNIISYTTCYGILASESSPLVQGNEISYVQAEPFECSFASGAGIWLYGQRTGTTPEVIGNTIENNTQSGLEDAGGNGGAGIAVWGGSPVISNNIIRNNATGKYFSPAGGGEGGGIYLEIAGGLIINNLIYGNTSNLGGGGIFVLGANGGASYSLALINNTIVDNAVVPVTTYSQAVIGGEQIYYQGGSNSAYTLNLSLENNVISGSTTAPSVVCYDGTINPVTYSHNDFYNSVGPATGIFISGTCTFPVGKNGNISADPSFVSAASHDYHLSLASPGVDTGDNDASRIAATLGSLDTTDLDNTSRVQDATNKGCNVDMGSYEHPGSTSACGISETIVSSLNPATVGQNITFTAQLNSITGTPTGSVQFLDGASILSTQVVSSTGSSSFSTSSLSVGTHAITANYQPTGAFIATTASLNETINGYSTSTALTCAPNSIPVFGTALLNATITSSGGTPAGTVTFTENGTILATLSLVNAAASYVYTGSVAATHTITATYNPTGPFAASTAVCTEAVTALPSATVLTVTPSTSLFGTPVTLSATVSPPTPPGPVTPSGSLTFYDGATALATSSLDPSGHAALTTTALTVSSHSLSAVYAGNVVYAASTSQSVLETIQPLPPDFSITLANPTITLRTQHHTTTTITLTSLNGFADSLAIVCSNLPQYLTCRPTPNPAPLAANRSSTVSLYLDTDSVLGYARNIAPPSVARTSSPVAWAFLLAPFSLFAGIRCRRRCKPALRFLMFLLVTLPLSIALCGCGEIIIPLVIPPSVAPGTYTIPITATGATSGISHATQLTLQVTP